MRELKGIYEADRDGFDQDPLGYSALARHKWGMARTMAGFPIDISKPASNEELKEPILWMTQAHALSVAAITILLTEQKFEFMPPTVRGACDSQYCAAGLMLVGYSLEICLKAMIILKEGYDGFLAIEKKVKHHRLQELSSFIPDLSKKELAILRGLTLYIYWAGRYPDPGTGREREAEEIFNLSEKYRITAKDLFRLSEKVMAYTENILTSNEAKS